MFPKKFHPLKTEEKPVESAASLFRLQCGVCALSVERHRERGQSETFHVRLCGGAAVGHQCKIDVPKTAVFKHVYLSAPPFFAGGSVHDQAIGRCAVAHHRFDAFGGADNGRTLNVMGAPVSHSGQCVVLAEQSDGWTAGSVFIHGAKSGGKGSDTSLDGKTAFFEIPCEHVDGFMLLEGCLRIVEEKVGHGGQSCLFLIQEREKTFFSLHEKQLHSLAF